MLEQAALREQFQRLLDTERQAQQVYADLLAKTDDEKIRQEIEQLCRDKQRHMQLAERLLEILD